jgi:hypothetical protein
LASVHQLSIPFKADSISWTSIIGACKAQGNEALLHKVANKLMETEVSPHSSLYVQLSSTLAALGDWDKSAEIRSMMHDRRISKNAGCSWIDRA